MASVSVDDRRCPKKKGSEVDSWPSTEFPASLRRPSTRARPPKRKSASISNNTEHLRRTSQRRCVPFHICAIGIILDLTTNLSQIKTGDFANTTFQQISSLLQQNPEYYTIWNYRRRLLLDVFQKELKSGNNVVSETETQPETTNSQQQVTMTLAQQEIAMLVKEDLQFLIPLIKQYPKCYWIWNHRSWLLATATQHLPAPTAQQLWQGELALDGKMLALDSRNFHAWDYRRKIVEELERLGGKSMVEAEFEYTTKMIQINLSNFSAWHNRSQLMPRLLDERDAGAESRKELFDGEFELITTALYTDPYDQSLWSYHQYLMSTLDPKSPINSADYARKTAILSPVSDADRTAYLGQELESIKEMLDGAEDCKYIYQALLEYSKRYIDLGVDDTVTTKEAMAGWLTELRKLDPLREGRWRDMERSMEP
jgi:geranylgeranyl transferase type-2 subunit alpha